MSGRSALAKAEPATLAEDYRLCVCRSDARCPVHIGGRQRGQPLSRHFLPVSVPAGYLALHGGGHPPRSQQEASEDERHCAYRLRDATAEPTPTRRHLHSHTLPHPYHRRVRLGIRPASPGQKAEQKKSRRTIVSHARKLEAFSALDREPAWKAVLT